MNEFYEDLKFIQLVDQSIKKIIIIKVGKYKIYYIMKNVLIRYEILLLNLKKIRCNYTT